MIKPLVSTVIAGNRVPKKLPGTLNVPKLSSPSTPEKPIPNAARSKYSPVNGPNDGFTHCASAAFVVTEYDGVALRREGCISVQLKVSPSTIAVPLSTNVTPAGSVKDTSYSRSSAVKLASTSTA